LDVFKFIYIKCAPGGAWLSSARVLKCLVRSSNERNPQN